MIKINVIVVHGIEFSTFTEKLREISDRPKFALPFLRGQSLNIFYGDLILKQQRHFKYIGVVVDESLSWNNHVSYVASRVYPKLKLLSRISSFLSPEILLKIYKTTNLPKYLRLWLHRMGFLQRFFPIFWKGCKTKQCE